MRVPVTSGGLVKLMLMLSFSVMNICVAVKTAVVPASAAWPIENRGLWRAGIRWHVCCRGPGRGKRPLVVLRMVALLATVTRMPGNACFSSSRGVWLLARCVVHPVSGIISASSVVTRIDSASSSVTASAWYGLVE